MNFLISTLVVGFMLDNYLVNVYTAETDRSGFYSYYALLQEGFYPMDGQKNWLLVRENPDKIWVTQAAKHYAEELKAMDESFNDKLGACQWTIEKNKNLAHNVLYSHHFGEIGALNQQYVFRYWNTTLNGEQVMWNTWIGKLYADYLYNTTADAQYILGVIDWIKTLDQYNPIFWVSS